MSKWSKNKNHSRKPEIGLTVLVLDADGYLSKAYFMGFDNNGYTDGSVWQQEGASGLKDYEVIAWMPLPAAPKWFNGEVA